MSFRNFSTQRILLPLSDFFLGRSISRNLAFIEKSQWWSFEELEEFQNSRLRKLIKYSYLNVPYYRQLFDDLKLSPEDIRSKDDLVNIPILTKEDIRQNFPDHIVDKNLKKGTYYAGATSGSTGEPLKYYMSKEAYSFNIACGLRAWKSMGYNLGDKYIKVSQNKRKTNEKQLQDILMNNQYLFLKNIDTESLENAIRVIRDSKPSVIRCYPDPLEFLAEIIEANRDDLTFDFELRAIATTGNVLHESARKKIERAFQTKIFDGYSCEGGAPFFECETHSCYHGAMEYGISEFVDVSESDNGLKQGRHIVTNLWNFSTPFIRYDSQDFLEWNDQKCTCGRGLIPIKRILGRDNDVLVTTKGKKIIVHTFTIFFSKCESVKQFQLVQEDQVNVKVNLVMNDNGSQIELDSIKRFCNETFDDNNMKLHFCVVNEIVTGKNGKRRFLINNYK